MYARVAVKPFLSETQRAIVAAGIEEQQTPNITPLCRATMAGYWEKGIFV